MNNHWLLGGKDTHLFYIDKEMFHFFSFFELFCCLACHLLI